MMMIEPYMSRTPLHYVDFPDFLVTRYTLLGRRVAERLAVGSKRIRWAIKRSEKGRYVRLASRCAQRGGDKKLHPARKSRTTWLMDGERNIFCRLPHYVYIRNFMLKVRLLGHMLFCIVLVE